MTNPNYIFLQNKGISQKILLDQLLYIRVEDYLLTCYLENDECFTCCKSLMEISVLLPASFVRVSRNCIVNKDNVRQLEKSKRAIILTNGSRHLVSHKRVREVFRILTG